MFVTTASLHIWFKYCQASRRSQHGQAIKKSKDREYDEKRTSGHLVRNAEDRDIKRFMWEPIETPLTLSETQGNNRDCFAQAGRDFKSPVPLGEHLSASFVSSKRAAGKTGAQVTETNTGSEEREEERRRTDLDFIASMSFATIGRTKLQCCPYC